MKYELKNIGYWPVIKIGFFINIILGFIFGIFYAMMVKVAMMAGGPMATMFGDLQGAEGAMDIVMVIMPFIFAFGNAFFGTILLVIITFFYNLLARLMGGLEMEFSEPSVQTEPVRYQQPPVYAQNQPQPAPPQPKPEPAPPVPPPPPPPVEPAPPEITGEPGIDEKREDHDDDKYKL